MEHENYAILVGIARYKSDADYPPLDGPRHDVAHLRKWLVNPCGGNVPRKNIRMLATPRPLLKLTTGHDPSRISWIPDQSAFIEAFNGVMIDGEGNYIHRNSRLYLYFSGHGFSQAADTTARAALFAANAYGSLRPNIPGTVYAEAAKRVALFREIVLIMDCCRDVQRNSPYANYEGDQSESGNAEKVRLFAMYAAAKNGKAQEREFTNQGKVYGLLTHSLVRALDEAPTNVLGQVSSTSLNNYLKSCWEKWCPPGYPAPERPRTVPADTGDIFFNSRRHLITQEFAVGSPDPEAVRLESADLDVVGEVADSQISWCARNDPNEIVIPFQMVDGARQFSLRLPPCEHTLSVAGRPESTKTFIPGEANVISL